VQRRRREEQDAVDQVAGASEGHQDAQDRGQSPRPQEQPAEEYEMNPEEHQCRAEPVLEQVKAEHREGAGIWAVTEAAADRPVAMDPGDGSPVQERTYRWTGTMLEPIDE
jgi:hypothetical protein